MMQKIFERVELDKIIPYKNNPRINDAAVDDVVKSIRECGNLDPIEIDEDGVILSGHTRLKALQRLEETHTDVIRVVGLAPRQKKAYRILANKAGEMSIWDIDKLAAELDSIGGIEGFDFGLDDLKWVEREEGEGDGAPHGGGENSGEQQENEGHEFGYHRERTITHMLLQYYDPDLVAGKYNIPILKACHYIPDRLVPFNLANQSGDYGAGVHFFVDDYRFERMWSMPEEQMGMLEKFASVTTPDYSLYMDMPLAMKIWNVYRSHLIGQAMQKRGMNVIPTLQWAGEETYEFAFDGIEPGGVVAVSSVGVCKDASAKEAWIKGMDEAMRRVQPECVLHYGEDPGYDYKGIKVKRYERYKIQ